MTNITELLENLSNRHKKDTYSMSVRELVSMFDDQRINLSPVYQRNFRWDEAKASKLIESLFLGIPIPPIFISVRDGKWDIIDGVQRISSILWFLGKSKTKLNSSLILSSLEELEYFNGKNANEIRELDSNAFFKFFEIRRLDIVLLVSDSTEAEYELFTRLNTGGLNLEPQEIRNFLVIKLNETLFNKLENLASEKMITDILSLSKKQIDINYHFELLLYIIIISNAYKKINDKDYIHYYKDFSRKFSDKLPRFIDKSIALCLNNITNHNNEIDNIKNIFASIDKNLPSHPFNKSNRFSPLLYIIIVSYIVNNKRNENLNNLTSRIFNNEEYIKISKRGTNVITNFVTGIEIGRNL